MDFSEAAQAAGAVVLFTGALAALYRYALRPLAIGIRRITLFLADWFGEDARDGVKARPSVMHRLEDLDYKAGRAEFHLGNGNPVPMRTIVEEHSDTLKEHGDTMAALTDLPVQLEQLRKQMAALTASNNTQ